MPPKRKPAAKKAAAAAAPTAEDEAPAAVVAAATDSTVDESATTTEAAPPTTRGKRAAASTPKAAPAAKKAKTAAKTPAAKPKAAAGKKRSKAEADADGDEEADVENGKDEAEAPPAKLLKNSSISDYTGIAAADGSILKIVNWNVAGWRSIIKKGFLDYVAAEQPDVLCLQEIKIPADPAAKDLPPGYTCLWNFSKTKPGYAGTAMMCKTAPISVTYGLEGSIVDKNDDEGRVITAEFDTVTVITAYVPNSARKLVRLDYRKEWDKDMLRHIKATEAKGKPVVWTGDLNVAHEEIDLANPKTNRNKSPGFTDAERAGLTAVLNAGFTDSLRHLHPKEVVYSYWTYMANARARNVGWRLDYAIVSNALNARLVDCIVRTTVMGSDHAPLVLTLTR